MTPTSSVRRTYSQDVKAQVVESVLERRLTAEAAGRAFVIPPSTVRGWVRRYREAGYRGLQG